MAGVAAASEQYVAGALIGVDTLRQLWGQLR
jgi:hypothetical protein